MNASFSASDFQPMTSDAQWQWVDVPSGSTTVRGITPVGRRETFYARLDTPTNATFAAATVYVRPVDGGSVLLRNAYGGPGGQLSPGALVVVNGRGYVVGEQVYAGTAPGEVGFILCDLDPGDVLVGMRLGYTPAPGEFVPVTPRRVFDSRVDGPTWQKGRIGRDAEFKVRVPAPMATQGAHAVHVNVTITGPTAAGFLSVYAAGTSWPGTSTLNWTGSGQVVAAGTTAGLGGLQPSYDPGINVYHGGQGEVDVIVDYTGYYRVGAAE
jgi:hypothetical protein